MGNLCRSIEYSSFLDECSHLHLSDCMFPLGKPVPHWTVTRGLPNLRINNFRIRLLVGCDGLEADASRFRARRLPGITPNDPVCKLCMGGIEDPAHFIAHCRERIDDWMWHNGSITGPASPSPLRACFDLRGR